MVVVKVTVPPHGGRISSGVQPNQARTQPLPWMESVWNPTRSALSPLRLCSTKVRKDLRQMTSRWEVILDYLPNGGELSPQEPMVPTEVISFPSKIRKTWMKTIMVAACPLNPLDLKEVKETRRREAIASRDLLRVRPNKRPFKVGFKSAPDIEELTIPRRSEAHFRTLLPTTTSNCRAVKKKLKDLLFAMLLKVEKPIGSLFDHLRSITSRQRKVYGPHRSVNLSLEGFLDRRRRPFLEQVLNKISAVERRQCFLEARPRGTPLGLLIDALFPNGRRHRPNVIDFRTKMFAMVDRYRVTTAAPDGCSAPGY